MQAKMPGERGPDPVTAVGEGRRGAAPERTRRSRVPAPVVAMALLAVVVALAVLALVVL
jgi:hypothetical protein